MTDRTTPGRNGELRAPEAAPGPDDSSTPTSTRPAAASLGSALLRATRSGPAIPAASEPVVDHLIERLASGAGGEEVAQQLARMGEPAVDPLLDALQREPSSEGKTRLGAALVALGEWTAPALRQRLVLAARGLDAGSGNACLDPPYHSEPEDAVERKDAGHRQPDPSDTLRATIQLAGALGSPSLVDPLRSVLHCDDAILRVEAAEALARVHGARAAAALAEAIASSLPGVPAAAARGLGVRALRSTPEESQSAQEILLATLPHALSDGDVPLARELMRALARLTTSEVVPVLSDLLRQTPLLRRTQHRALQRLAIETLSRLPGEDAARTLEAAAQHGRRSVRLYARQRLARANAKADPLQ